ncbi:TlpA family protein disulfide reductase [Mucilaginibacter pallidiroseus]|uniref:TlpA family protein disulfide reductase n=1 Tax=Mucilaginibacter pallidiroseus TaxID=2599295 RepID=A0A563UIH9_9SPHI|nr:TlpA disulfide reductase family protein [Mucilaginibacter pallidiroseus]TWR31116.1 TlpA family protein disulfide reductase [Mucilaginibacter pallidiroseus]
MKTSTKPPSILSKNTLLNLVFAGGLLLVLFNPTVKALLLQGLIKIGLFQPGVSIKDNPSAIPENLTFTDAANNQVSLASLKGKVVFINFWATWCPPCLAEIPSINALNNKIKADKNFVIMMVDVDANLSKSAPFIQNKGYNLHVYAPTSSIPESMLGNSIPSTVIINKKGQLVFKHEGVADYNNEKVIAYLQKLAAE